MSIWTDIDNFFTDADNILVALGLGSSAATVMLNAIEAFVDLGQQVAPEVEADAEALYAKLTAAVAAVKAEAKDAKSQLKTLVQEAIAFIAARTITKTASAEAGGDKPHYVIS